MASAAAPDGNAGDGSRSLVVAAIAVALFVSAISQTVVSTALPRIIGELGGLSMYSWVLTASMLASTVSVPLAGKLSDRYGRKRFLMGGIAFFLIATIVTGTSRSMTQLIAFRAVQGLASGVIMASAFATIGELFAPAERGRFMGLFTGVYGVASIAGPLIGGFVTDHLGWRWVFYVNAPFGVIALLILAKWLPSRGIVRRAAPLDWPGMVALLWAVVPALLALSLAGQEFPWQSWQMAALFAASGAGLCAFIAIESRAEDPVLALPLFRERTFAVVSAVSFLTGIGLFASLSYMPLFIQGVLGATATNSGLVNTPLMLGLTAGSMAAGQRASRTLRYRWLVLLGGSVLSAGMAVMVTLDESSSIVLPLAGMAVVGLGLGLSMPLLSLAVQNALSDRMLGVATASSQFFRQVGGTLGVAVFGSVVSSHLRDNLNAELPSEVTSAAPPELVGRLENPRILLSPDALDRLRGAFGVFGDDGPALYDSTVHAMRVTLANGLHEVFLLGLGVALVALAVSVLLPERELASETQAVDEPAPREAGAVEVARERAS